MFFMPLDLALPLIKRPILFPAVVFSIFAPKFIPQTRHLSSILLCIPAVLYSVSFVLSKTLGFGHEDFFWVENTFYNFITPGPVKVLEHVLKIATPNDADSVVKAIDDYCWEHPTMNVGDVKGKIVDEVILKHKPKLSVELGAFIGYSTVRFANILPNGAELISVDPNPFAESIKTTLVKFAGLSDRVTNYFGYSNDFLTEFAERKETIDFLFVDHVKDLYLRDVELAYDLKLFKKGSVVVADNVQFPGAPAYKKWIMNHPRFLTEVKETFLEYSNTIRDEVLISEFLGYE